MLAMSESHIGIDTIHICTPRWRPIPGRILPWRQIGDGRELFKIGNVVAMRNRYGYLTLAFSPQNLLAGKKVRCNTNPLSLLELRKAMCILRKAVREAGIRVDIGHAPISRIDLFSDFFLPRSVSEILPRLSRVKIPYLKPPRRFTGTTSTSLYLANKSREICIYDKAAELVDRRNRTCGADSLPDAYLPNHTLRIELRFRKPRSVRSHLGLSDLCSLLRGEQTLYRLAACYNHMAFPLLETLGCSGGLSFPSFPLVAMRVSPACPTPIGGARPNIMKKQPPCGFPLFSGLFAESGSPSSSPRGPPRNRVVRGRA